MTNFVLNRNRLEEMARNRIGVIFKGAMGVTPKLQRYLYRNLELNLYDSYLDNTAYDHLPAWDCDISDQQMDDRTTQPKLIFPMPEISTGIVNGLVTAEDSRLMFNVDSVNEQENIEKVTKKSHLWNYLSYLLPSLLCNGSAFIKIYRSPKGKIMMKFYNSKHCWPVFDAEKELESIEIRYVFDAGEYDENGKKVLRWSRQVLSKSVDVMYDNPIFRPELDELPEFSEVQRVEHNLGFVQGAWMTTTFWNHIPDGESYILSSIPLLDSLNYMLSKEDSVLYYNLFPLLMGYGISPDDFEDMKPQNQTSEGKIKGMNALAIDKPPDRAQLGFLESAMTGLQLSDQYHLRMLQLIQYSLKSVLLDPEKIAAHAQSAKAMEALHRPVIQYVKKIRPQIEMSVCQIMQIVENLSNAYPCEIKLPKGIVEDSNKKWGTIFEDTPADIAQKVQYASNAVISKMISKKTATTHLASSFGVKNVEEELKQIESEKAEEFEDEKLMNDMMNPPNNTNTSNKGKSNG